MTAATLVDRLLSEAQVGAEDVAVPGSVAASLLAGDATEWVERLWSHLLSAGAIKIRTADHGPDPARRLELAQAILSALSSEARRRHGLAELKLEVHGSEGASTAEGHSTRSLLPHHDGQHSTYLTPSVDDVASFDPILRRFRHSGKSVTSPSHKLVQAIWIEEAGSASSVTTFYNWVRLAKAAFAHQNGRAGSIEEVGAFIGENIRRAIATQRQHGSEYIGVGASLGSTRAVFNLSLVVAERQFGSRAVKQHPDLLGLTEDCPCGACIGPGERFLCWAFVDTMGCDWSTIRSRTESRIEARTGDLVLSDNVCFRHGARAGGADRRIVQMFLSMPEPSGVAYERWLARRWRECWGPH